MITPIHGTIRDSYDGILGFSRPSVAYDAQGRRYGPGQMRFEPGKHGMATRIEEGAVNYTPPVEEWQQGSIRSGDGTNQSQSTRIRTTKHLTIAPSTQYTISFASGFKIFWFEYAADGTYIQSSGEFKTTSPVTFTSHGDAGRLRIIVANMANSAISVDELKAVSLQIEAKPYSTTFTVGERQPELLTIPMSVLDSVNPTNLLTGNHSNGGENGTTSGLRPTGAYTSSSDEVAWEGTRSFRITTKGEFDHEGVFTDYDTVRVVPGRTYSIRARVYGVSGVVRAVLRFLVDGIGRDTFSPSITLDGSWQEATVTAVAPENAANASLMIRVTGTQVITFYIDGLQLNEGDPVDWCLGGHRLLLGPSEGTIEGWIYVEDTMRRNAGDYRQLWDIPLPGVKDRWALALYQMGTTSKYYVGVRPQPSEHQTTSFDYADVSEGWHYFGVSWGSGTTEICVDGVKRGEIAAVPSQLGEVLAIGGRADNLFHTNTLHDDIRLSSVKRSAAEQLAIFDSGQPAPYDEHTTYLWRADGPSAQRVTRAVVL
jgi:hypothetical protein